MATSDPNRPHRDDYLRALAYFGLLCWSILFSIFNPIDINPDILPLTRVIWMGATMIGAFWACLGALVRIDLKMELPGLILAFVGPLFYYALQMFYIFHPIHPGDDISGRIPLSCYVLLPCLLMLPRMFGLISEARRLRKIVESSRELEALLAEKEAGQ